MPINMEDQFRFILHSEIMWQGSDADFAAPMVEITRKLFPDFRAASFDRGFHSPENRATLDPKFSSWSLIPASFGWSFHAKSIR